MKPPTGTPCSECPFQRQSLPGYTGSADAQEFGVMAAYGEFPLPCHMRVYYSDPQWRDSLHLVPACSGHTIFLTNSGKLPRNPEVKLLPPDHTLVFSHLPEFLNHHVLQVKPWSPKKKPKRRGSRKGSK